MAATHAAFGPDAAALFDATRAAFDRPDAVVVTDSVPIRLGFASPSGASLTVLSVASSFAETIRRMEQDWR